MKFWIVAKFVIVIILMKLILWCQGDYEDYKKLRHRLLDVESRSIIGHNITLTDKEKKVDSILYTLKRELYNKTNFRIDYVNYTHHYYYMRHIMKRSKLFQFLKKMPKGIALHIHDLCVLGSEYLIRITYKAHHLYGCFEKNNISFLHSKKPPSAALCKSWTLVSDERARSRDPAAFDAMLRQHLTMFGEYDNAPFLHPTTAWSKYVYIFNNIKSLVSFKPIYEQYYEDLLQTLMEDGATYAEIRSVIPELYDLEGKTYTSKDTMNVIDSVTKRFTKENPSFLGATIIYAPFATNDSKVLSKQLDIANEIKRNYSKYLTGLDQIWGVDQPLELGNDSAKLLAESDLHYFFHAGATQWNGKSDNFLYDALALKSRRIGNAYALLKHHALVKRVKKKKIAIEVNLISDQIFGLTFDFKIHPLAYYLAQDMPVTISSDMPGLWDSEPCTEDYFVATAIVASRLCDLRMLKQLVFNSIKYSSLKIKIKKRNARKFKKQWEEFLDQVLQPKNRQ